MDLTLQTGLKVKKVKVPFHQSGQKGEASRGAALYYGAMLVGDFHEVNSVQWNGQGLLH